MRHFIFFISIGSLVMFVALFSALFISGSVNLNTISEEVKNSRQDVQGNPCPPGMYPIMAGSLENKPLWACSTYDEGRRAEVSRKVNEIIERLAEAGIYPDPVHSVSYELEDSMFTVYIRRPPTDSEYELLINTVPKPFTIYRSYGPIDYPCDNKNHPIKAWVGNGLNTEYSELDVERYLLAERALKERYQYVLVGYPDVYPNAHDTIIVLLGKQEVTDDDIQFIRSLFPPQISIEIWTNRQDVIVVTLIPSYIQILCGSTIIDGANNTR